MANNSALTHIGLFAKGQCQELPDVVLVTDEYFASDVKAVIHTANKMYDDQYAEEGTAEGRIEYIIQALDDAEVPYENVSDDIEKIYL